MKVLYISGSCLTKNTSANLSHNAYIQGLLENGCDVDIIMAKDSWGQNDSGIPMWDNANYYIYDSTAFYDKLRRKARESTAFKIEIQTNRGSSDHTVKYDFKKIVRSIVKKLFYKIFPNDPLYPLEKTWLNKASKFRCADFYDIVVSNSSPAASHKLAKQLIDSGHVKCGRWIQIWEDPWYMDLYNSKEEKIFIEEHKLLQAAEEIYYVSPLTLIYQQRLFPDCAVKMKHIPLPSFEVVSKVPETILKESSGVCFGYFGDFYSITRNIEPFYNSLKGSGCNGFILGDTDLSLESTDKIFVSGRVTLDVLSEYQDKTSVLVHLSNLKGGQIPGKIYHYSATNKPILFILDGTEEERKLIKSYFEQFERYYFCENNKESIDTVIKRIVIDIESGKTWSPVKDFAPHTIIADIL